jgi:hypothetical protein
MTLTPTTADTPAVHDANLLAALTYATEHPERHQQGWWLTQLPTLEGWCGTAGCIAGITVQLHGWLPPKDLEVGELAEYVYRDGVQGNVPVIARELLGLTIVQGDWLFAPANSLQELWEIAHTLTEGRITIPPQFTDSDGGELDAWHEQ